MEGGWILDKLGDYKIMTNESNILLREYFIEWGPNILWDLTRDVAFELT
jgi:hypothetical protein